MIYYRQLFIHFTLLLLISLTLALFFAAIDFFFNFCLQDCICEIHYTLSNDSSDYINHRSFEYENNRCSTLNYSDTSYFTLKKIKSSVFKDINTDIEKQTKFILYKIKLYNRTLSWFFKGSKPGGGRGL